jgi:hypothetical protein
MRHHEVSRLQGRDVRRRGVIGGAATDFDRGNQDTGAESRYSGEELAMNEYFYEHIVREQFRTAAALDQQLTRWGWFARNAHQPRASAWRVRVGQILIRLGCWLQGTRVRPARNARDA